MQFFSDQTLFNQKSNSNIHVTLPPSPCRLVIVLPCLLFVSSLNANMKLFESWQIAILHKARSSLQKTTLCDIHRRWCTRITTFLSLVVKFGSSSGRIQVAFGSHSGRVRVEFGSSLGRVWVEFGSSLGWVWIRFRLSLGQIWVEFGLRLGRVWLNLGQIQVKFIEH